MDTSLIIILLVALVIIQGVAFWVYMTRRRTTVQKKDETPNFEIVRKTLLNQLYDLGVRKPELHLFSARFALEGYREGNARKVQSSGIRELQYHILETIRDRGSQLKIRTAAYVFIDYLDRVIESLTEEKERLVKEHAGFEAFRTSWEHRRAVLDENVEAGLNRIHNFFTDRIPNAESFAEREATVMTPDKSAARDFSSIVVKPSEVHSLAGQIAGEIDGTILSAAEWFWEKTGWTPATPEIPRTFDEGALKRLKTLATERGPGNDDGVPAVVAGLLEVQKLLQAEFSRAANENIEKTAGDIRDALDQNVARIAGRRKSIEEALTKFRSLRNEFHAHE